MAKDEAASKMKRKEYEKELRKLQSEGMVRHVGASVESMEEALACVEQGVDSLQIIFNVFRRTPAELLFDKASRQGVAIIVRLPLASGLLSGKIGLDTKFPANDHRNYNRDGQKFNVGETFAGGDLVVVPVLDAGRCEVGGEALHIAFINAAVADEHRLRHDTSVDIAPDDSTGADG